MIFCPERLRDFFDSERLHDSCLKRLNDFFVPRGCMILFCPKRLRDFFCPKRLLGFFVPRGWVIFAVPRG